MTIDSSFLRLQARTQRFTLGTPRGFQVSPDGRRVLFLRSASGEDRQHVLWRLDLATGTETSLADPRRLLGAGEEELPPAERARRERSREQAGGVVAYATDRPVTAAAFALSGQLHVTDFAAGLTFGLDGRIQRVADKVFLLTPRNVEVSAEERRRLQERGFFNQA